MGSSLVASSWGSSWGNSWGNSWGQTALATGGAGKGYYPKDFYTYLFARGKIKKYEKEVLKISDGIPELKDELESYKEKYFEFIELIESIPEYEHGIIKTQEDRFISDAGIGITKILSKIRSGLDIDIIIALLAGGLDEIEVGLVISECL